MRKRRSKINWYFCLCAVLFSVFWGSNLARAQTADKDLPNFQKLDEHFLRGAQPTPEGILKLKAMKVATVINLRAGGRLVAAEKQLVESAGMRFVNIPFNDWRRPKDADIDQILQLIGEPQNQPVFIHCERGADRTGTVAAIYRINQYAWSAKQALTEAKAYKLGWWQFWMKDYINDYYRRYRQKGGKPVARFWLPSADREFIGSFGLAAA